MATDKLWNIKRELHMIKHTYILNSTITIIIIIIINIINFIVDTLIMCPFFLLDSKCK